MAEKSTTPAGWLFERIGEREIRVTCPTFTEPLALSLDVHSRHLRAFYALAADLADQAAQPPAEGDEHSTVAATLAAHNAWRRYNGDGPEPRDIPPQEVGIAIDAAVRLLRAARPQQPSDVQPKGTADIEGAAQAVYALFEGADQHPWVPGGNSLKQDEARRYVRVALEAAQAPAPGAVAVAGDYKQAPGSKNCMQSAVAYMLGLPMEAVPDFEKAGPHAWDLFEQFFDERGFSAEMFPPNVEIAGDYLASGPTERGTSHMVVMRGGELLHDPHPSNAGLTSPQVVWVIARKAGPSPAVVDGEKHA